MADAGSGRRDAAFASFLTLLLVSGVLGVLLLNTAMQRQADLIATQHARIAALAQQAQLLRARRDRREDPQALAARAAQLRLRPAKSVRYVDVSARPPAAGRDRAG